MLHDFIPLFTFDKNVAYIVSAFGVVIVGLVFQGVANYRSLTKQLRSIHHE